MLNRKLLLVPAFLLAQGVLVLWATAGEYLPPEPDFSRFPEQIGEWRRFQEEPVADDVKAQLRADRILNATFTRRNGFGFGNVFIAWFQSQRGGASQPHSPKVCLPGSGWNEDGAATVSLTTSAGVIPVNRYVISKAGTRAVVLYWYQSPRRVLAGEFEAKAWLLADAMRDHRTDTALVRILVWETANGDQEAIARAEELAQQVYPAARGLLPH